MKTFDVNISDSYFSEGSVEWPSMTLGEILPLGQLWDNVGSVFLNAWINHVDIVEAVLLTRYQPHSENLENARKFHAEAMPGRHTDDPFRDDAVILARAGKKDTDGWRADHWWFFWFDRDCSDSSIGRFHTTDPPELVRENFRRWATETGRELSTAYGNNDEPCDPIALDPAAFTGWIKL